MSRVGYFLALGVLGLLPLVSEPALARSEPPGAVCAAERDDCSQTSSIPASPPPDERRSTPVAAVSTPASQVSFIQSLFAFFEFLAEFFQIHVQQAPSGTNGGEVVVIAAPAFSPVPETLPITHVSLSIVIPTPTPQPTIPHFNAVITATTAPQRAASISVVLTFYGWGDTTPPDTAQIAYPASRYPAAKHTKAGGRGTWDDPITFASSVQAFPVGAVLWIPTVQKYAIMEDDCTACDAAWKNDRRYQIALWTGAANAQQVYSEQNCETALGANMSGSAAPIPVAIFPPSNEPVSTIPLFDASNGACFNGMTYDNTPHATTGSLAQHLSPATTTTHGSSANISWSNGQPIPASFLARVYGNTGPFYQQLPENPQIASYSASAVSYYYAGNPDFEVGFFDSDSGQEQYDYSFPVYIASANDPLVTISCNHVTTADCVDSGVQIHLPAQAKQAGGGDHHLAVLEPDGMEYDFWLVTSNPPYGSGSQISAAGEAHFAIDGSNFGRAYVAPGFDEGAATAGGIALLIGQIYTSELTNGTIDHAISLIFPCGTNAWVYPATQTTGICANGQGMPLGSRLWWAPSDAQTQAMPLPRDIQTILIAMHHYGAFFTDNGGGSVNINGQGVGAGAHLENQEPYWHYGNGKDPALDYAVSAGWKHIAGSGVNRYLLSAPGSSVDFLKNLKVLDPCVTQKNC